MGISSSRSNRGEMKLLSLPMRTKMNTMSSKVVAKDTGIMARLPDIMDVSTTSRIASIMSSNTISHTTVSASG
ncbi:hypothetical protein ES705_41273 [subsurface metagenome]